MYRGSQQHGYDMGVYVQKSNKVPGRKLLVTQLLLLALALVLNLSLPEKSALVWTASALLTAAVLLTLLSFRLARKHHEV